MGIIRDTLKRQINDNNRQQSNDTTATIIEYNTVLNVAKIHFINPNSGETMYRENVSLSNTLGGVIGSGIYPGQTCTITFINNNVYAPVITGLTGSNYASKTCTDQGAYIVDTNLLSLGKPEITPMTKDWIEEENINSTKYNNDLGDYTNVDTANVMHEILNTLDKYKDTEQGITNLATKSTVKLKENGDIDLFVTNNIGIRICPGNKTIEFYGMKFLFNGTEIKDFTIQDGDNPTTNNTDNSSSEVENLNVSDIMKITEILKLFDKIDGDVEELKLCIKYTTDLTGNALSALSLKIKEYESFKERFNNNLNTTSSTFIQDTYNALISYDKLFSKELSDAADILEV